MLNIHTTDQVTDWLQISDFSVILFFSDFLLLPEQYPSVLADSGYPTVQKGFRIFFSRSSFTIPKSIPGLFSA
jgi:hypothetical protein